MAVPPCNRPPMSNATLEEAPPQAPASLWEDFIDIFYAPRQVFARRQYAGYGLVLLVLTVIGAALFFAAQGPLADAFAAEYQRAIRNAGGGAQEMTAEQAGQARRMGTIFGSLTVLVAFPVAVMVTGLMLWMLGKLFGFAGTVGMAMVIVTYAQFPRIVQSVALLLQGLLMRPDTLAATSVGPARFVDPDTASAALVAFLTRLDVFYIWSTVLIAIGAQVIGRVPRAQSYLLAALVWLIGGLPMVLGALVS